MTAIDRIVKLYQQLFPTGRAFRLYENGNNLRFHTAIANGRAKFNNDTKSTLESLLPDNSHFTVDDATDWERRLGMVSSPLVDLETRKAAIFRKMASPGVNPARSGAAWLEYQLQQAGFDVYVYENRFPSYPSGWERITPEEFNANIFEEVEHGVFEHGQLQHKYYYNSIIANSIDNDVDVENFNNITDFGASFFIGGPTFGTYANVLATREIEFRTLVIGQKQTQAIAFAFINLI